MPRIEITQAHDRSAEELGRVLAELRRTLSAQYGFAFTCARASDREVQLERTGASGFLRVEPGRFVLRLDLSFALSPMRRHIEQTCERLLREQATAPPSTPCPAEDLPGDPVRTS